MENIKLLDKVLLEIKDWGTNHGLPIIVILLTSLILIKILQSAVNRIEKKFEGNGLVASEREKRIKTITGLLNTSIKVVISIAALMMIVTELGIAIGPLLAGAGIAGIAIGFGAQSLVKDIISGFFLLFEDQIRVGDVVKIAGIGGLVEAVNLRTTRLRDLEGKVHIIPNGIIDVATNYTKDWSRALVEIGVAYKEDVDNVISVLEEVGEKLRNDPEWKASILEPMTVQGLDSFGESSVNIRIYFKTLPLRQWDVSREYKKRIKKAFDEKGIEIPFPHRTLYMGEAENKGRLQVEALIEEKQKQQS